MRKTPASRFVSPGFGFVQPCLAFSGRPIGEPRFNNRYYDYDANYDAAKKTPTHSQIYLLAGSHSAGQELEVTIGHKLYGCELKLAALKKRAQYRSSSYRVPLNSFYRRISRFYRWSAALEPMLSLRQGATPNSRPSGKSPDHRVQTRIA